MSWSSYKYKATEPIPLTLAQHSVREYERAENEPRTHALVDQYPATEVLPGWVNAYYVYENGRKCGPYYVRRWKVKGKLHKQYVAEGVFAEPSPPAPVTETAKPAREGSPSSSPSSPETSTISGPWSSAP